MENVRFQHPIATTAQWEDKNPTLLNGEIGIELVTVDSITYTRTKIGNGIDPWIDLGYADIDLYPYTQNTTGTVGGAPAGSNFYNKPVHEVINTILNPYLNPSIGTLRVDGATSITKEIGQTYDQGDNVTLTWSLSNSGNVANDNSGTIWSSENVVDEFGDSSNKGAINIKTASPFTATWTNDYTKTLPGSLTFYVRGFNTQGGAMSTRSRTINWLGRVRFGSSTLTNITDASQITALNSSALTSGNRDYTVPGGDAYTYICFPEYMNLTAAIFEDIDPNTGNVISTYAIRSQADWDASYAATIPYTNSHGLTFNYKVYRSQYKYGASTICRAKLITS